MGVKNAAGQNVGGVGTLKPSHPGPSWHHMVLNFIAPALRWEAETSNNVTTFEAITQNYSKENYGTSVPNTNPVQIKAHMFIESGQFTVTFADNPEKHYKLFDLDGAVEMMPGGTRIELV